MTTRQRTEVRNVLEVIVAWWSTALICLWWTS
jgi:hypothetical protein